MKNRIKVLRAERNMTQEELAIEVQVSRQTINAIEKQKFDPSLPLAFRISRLFQLTIEDVFHDDQPGTSDSANATIIPSGPRM